MEPPKLLELVRVLLLIDQELQIIIKYLIYSTIVAPGDEAGVGSYQNYLI
jgi:hypothetical protein